MATRKVRRPRRKTLNPLAKGRIKIIRIFKRYR